MAASMSRIAEVLKTVWGYDSFRPLQREAMESVLAGRDSVIILPTGGGKSLCFQAPALAMPGMAVVVSPLIALMKDQVDALDANGVRAECINSMNTAEDKRRIDADIRGGALKLLYVTPERLAQPRFIEYLQRHEISFIAIDEAHCISMWGHDFRPEYRALKGLRDTFPGIGIHAYTATATPQVQEEIVRELALRDPSVHVGSFDRPNLVYRMVRRTDRMAQIKSVLDQHPGESGIVYCIRRKDTEEVAEELNRTGHKALPYHAGLGDAERRANQEAFIQERADIIVATVAFGMGIDKSNVRYVIHAGMPKSIEHYQQESGRAGRDSLEADCVMLYGAADFQLWRKMLAEGSEEQAAVALQKLEALYRFCTGTTCRHETIVRYFGQPWAKSGCGACDVCLDELATIDNAGEVARFICAAVDETGQRYGGAYVAGVLAGKPDERAEQNRHTRIPTFGALQTEAVPTIRGWIEQLVAGGLLIKTGDYGVIELTKSGRGFLAGSNESVPRLLEPHRRPEKRAKVADGESWEGVDRALFEVLRTLRRDMAQEMGKPPYVIFSDKTLRDMARKRPSTLAAMLHVHGVGKQKNEAFGQQFLDLIDAHCAATGLSRDEGLEIEFEPPPPPAPKGELRVQSEQKAFALFRAGHDVESVMEQFGRARSTIMNYLAAYIAEEPEVDILRWTDQATLERVRTAAEEHGTAYLKPIHEALNGEVDYDTIRIAVAFIGRV